MMPVDVQDNPLGLMIGDHLRDNDVRSEGRVITVEAIQRSRAGKWFAIYRTSRLCRISFDRIHVDGTLHSQGYNLVLH